MKKSAFVVTTTPLQTVLSDQLRKDCNEVIGGENVRQVWVKKRDANGARLPKNVDLFESGDLKDSMDAGAEGYRFNKDYAEHVERRVSFAGLTEDALSEVMPKLQQLFDDAGQELLGEGE